MTQDNLDEKLLKIVREKRFIRRKDLFKLVGKETSLPTFNRATKRMCKHKELAIIDKGYKENVFLKDSDKRATYITLYKNKLRIDHLNTVLESLKKEGLEKQNALVEIESLITDVFLTPGQLDLLSSHILGEDPKISEHIIRIIFSNIDEIVNFPMDVENFTLNIKQFLRQYDQSGLTDNTKAKIIRILGILKDEMLISLLKDEIKKGTSYTKLVDWGFTSWQVAELIDNSASELFEFQNKLSQESISKVVFKIRSHARKNVEAMEKDEKEFRKKYLESFKEKI